MGGSARTRNGQSAERGESGPVKRIVYLSRGAGERLTIHAGRQRVKPSAIVEGLILRHLPQYVVALRGGAGGGEAPSD